LIYGKEKYRIGETKKLTEKLNFRKYDPVVRKHVEFKEEKLKS
jgi:ribosomal protein L33